MYINNKDGSFTLFLQGKVGEDTILEDLNKILTDYPETEKIEILIDSVGGSLDRAYNIVDFLDTIKNENRIVKTVVTGKAYSSASLIAAAGTKGERYLGANAGVMIHKATINDPSLEFMDETINAKFSEKMAQITGADKEIFANIFNSKKDYYFTSIAELQEIGVLDKHIKYYSEEEIKQQARIVAELELNQTKNQLKMDQITQLQADLAAAQTENQKKEAQITKLQEDLSLRIAEVTAIQESILKNAKITAEQKETLQGVPVAKMIDLVAFLEKDKKEPIKQFDSQASATAMLEENKEKTLIEKLKAGEKIENYRSVFAMQTAEVKQEIKTNFSEIHYKNFTK